MLSKFQKENLKSFEVKTDAVLEFNQWKDDFMKDTSMLAGGISDLKFQSNKLNSLDRGVSLLVQSRFRRWKDSSSVAWEHSSLP